MRAEDKIAENKRGVALLFELGERKKVSFRLRHLAFVNQKEFAVHPDIRKGNAICGFRLRNFVRVVRADVVHAAGMDIERLAEKMPRDGGTFDMPSREILRPTATANGE